VIQLVLFEAFLVGKIGKAHLQKTGR
jgi:hypothetical protein